MKRKFWILSLVGSALLGVFLHHQDAEAYTCNNGTCLCGDEDINPANGLPYLPQGQWDGDCTELVNACDRLGGEFQCTNYCGVDSCCGGECTYDP